MENACEEWEEERDLNLSSSSVIGNSWQGPMECCAVSLTEKCECAEDRLDELEWELGVPPILLLWLITSRGDKGVKGLAANIGESGWLNSFSYLSVGGDNRCGLRLLVGKHSSPWPGITLSFCEIISFWEWNGFNELRGLWGLSAVSSKGCENWCEETLLSFWGDAGDSRYGERRWMALSSFKCSSIVWEWNGLEENEVHRSLSVVWLLNGFEGDINFWLWQEVDTLGKKRYSSHLWTSLESSTCLYEAADSSWVMRWFMCLGGWKDGVE